MDSVLRIGEGSGEKIGSAGPLAIGIAVGEDLLSVAAAVAPEEGAAKSVVGKELAAAVEEGAAAFRGGESAAAAFGREIHVSYDYGPGFIKEFRGLPSGARPDAVNLVTREVVELKPDTRAAIRQGQAQLRRYATELNREYPGRPFTTRIITYPQYKP